MTPGAPTSDSRVHVIIENVISFGMENVRLVVELMDTRPQGLHDEISRVTCGGYRASFSCSLDC